MSDGTAPRRARYDIPLDYLRALARRYRAGEADIPTEAAKWGCKPLTLYGKMRRAEREEHEHPGAPPDPS